MVEGYYDLCIRYVPEDAPSMERFLSLAKHFGFIGAGITQVSGKEPVPSTGVCNTCFDLVSGIEIHEENPSKLHSIVNRYSKRTGYVIVQGGLDKLNRSAVETPDVDILSLPLGSKDNGLDHVVARSAADRGVALEFDVGSMIRHRGGKRVLAMSELRQRLMLARKFKVQMVLTSGARSFYDIRGPKELIALANLVGMTNEEAVDAMIISPAAILKRKRKVHGYVMDGVELIGEQFCSESKGEFC